MVDSTVRDRTIRKNPEIFILNCIHSILWLKEEGFHPRFDAIFSPTILSFDVLFTWQ